MSSGRVPELSALIDAAELVRAYARHEDDCAFTGHPSTFGCCDCGFDEALRRYREAFHAAVSK